MLGILLCALGIPCTLWRHALLLNLLQPHTWNPLASRFAEDQKALRQAYSRLKLTDMREALKSWQWTVKDQAVDDIKELLKTCARLQADAFTAASPSW